MYEVQEKQDFLKGTMTLGVSSVGSSTLEPSDNTSSLNSAHFLNSKAYWVLEPLEL